MKFANCHGNFKPYRFQAESSKLFTSEHRGGCKIEQPKVDPKGERAGAKDSKKATSWLGSNEIDCRKPALKEEQTLENLRIKLPMAANRARQSNAVRKTAAGRPQD